MCACSTPGLLPHPAALDCQIGHTPGAAVGPTSAPGTPRWPPRPALSHPLPADTAPRAAGAPGAGSPGPAAAEALPAGHAGAAAAAPSRPLWRPAPEHFGLQDGICSFSAAWIGKKGCLAHDLALRRGTVLPAALAFGSSWPVLIAVGWPLLTKGMHGSPVQRLPAGWQLPTCCMASTCNMAAYSS